MKTYESLIWNFFRGKRTYILGFLALAYGWYFKDPQAIILGLGVMGVRAGISNDISKLMTQKTPVTKEEVVTTIEKDVVAPEIPSNNIATPDTTPSSI